MKWTKIGTLILILLCALSGVSSVIIAGMIIYTRANIESQPHLGGIKDGAQIEKSSR